jgi:hypothetical protein
MHVFEEIWREHLGETCAHGSLSAEHTHLMDLESSL